MRFVLGVLNLLDLVIGFGMVMMFIRELARLERNLRELRTIVMGMLLMVILNVVMMESLVGQREHLF